MIDRRVRDKSLVVSKVFFHIGLHKTGSTLIQNFCVQNRDLLLAQKLLYPETGSKWNGHHILPWSLGVGHPRYEADEEITPGELLNQISAEAAEFPDSRLLLSSEDFEFLAPRHLQVLKAHFSDAEIKIIVYVRRQDLYLESEYAQHVRMDETRFDGTIADFYMKFDFMQRYDYLRLLRPWETAFGKSALLVRPFESRQFTQGDLLKDFCEQIDVAWQTDFSTPKREESNVRLDAKSLSVLRELNKIDLSTSDRETILVTLSSHASTLKDSDYLLAERNALDFLGIFKKSNLQVARRYLGREDGMLFLDDRP